MNFDNILQEIQRQYRQREAEFNQQRQEEEEEDSDDGQSLFDKIIQTRGEPTLRVGSPTDQKLNTHHLSFRRRFLNGL